MWLLLLMRPLQVMVALVMVMMMMMMVVVGGRRGDERRNVCHRWFTTFLAVRLVLARHHLLLLLLLLLLSPFRPGRRRHGLQERRHDMVSALAARSRLNAVCVQTITVTGIHVSLKETLKIYTYINMI